MEAYPVPQKPKTLTRTINAALISWENLFPGTIANAKFILQIENSFREWKTVYWGPKKQFLVEDLAPCSCYNFRIKSDHVADDSDSSEWVHFKSGTDAIPYFVMHFTRAVKFGKTPVIRKIINRRPVLLETENKEGKTPLIQAVEGGNLQMVTFLINLGANVNTATLITKRTPLMVALFNNNLQISNLLIDKGANLHAKDCNFLTGLHHAVDSGYLENVELCLNHEFDVNAQDNKGWTPLLRAVVLNCPDEIVSLLLSKDADLNIKDRNGFDFYKHVKLTNRKSLDKFVLDTAKKEKVEKQEEEEEKEEEEEEKEDLGKDVQV